MYTNNRDTYRQTFANTWQKHLKGTTLDAVESELLAVILLHPEYHSLFDSAQKEKQEFIPEENPYIHMSLHMAIREQIRMDKPLGTKEIYNNLQKIKQNPHEVEHIMMTVMAKLLWESQQSGVMPNDDTYLCKLREHASLTT